MSCPPSRRDAVAPTVQEMRARAPQSLDHKLSRGGNRAATTMTGAFLKLAAQAQRHWMSSCSPMEQKAECGDSLSAKPVPIVRRPALGFASAHPGYRRCDLFIICSSFFFGFFVFVFFLFGGGFFFWFLAGSQRKQQHSHAVGWWRPCRSAAPWWRRPPREVWSALQRRCRRLCCSCSTSTPSPCVTRRHSSITYHHSYSFRFHSICVTHLCGRLSGHLARLAPFCRNRHVRDRRNDHGRRMPI